MKPIYIKLWLFIQLLIFPSLGIAERLKHLSFEEFTSLAVEVSHKVDLFKHTWQQDPDAEFFGGTTRDYLYWLKGLFRHAKSKAEYLAIINHLKSAPFLQVRDFIIGDSDVDIASSKSLHLKVTDYGVRKIDAISKSRFDPTTPEGHNEAHQGHIPIEKIRLGKNGFVYWSGFGDGIREIYEGKPTLSPPDPLKFELTYYASRGENHPLLLVIRYLRTLAINYYQSHGRSYPDKKILFSIDSSSQRFIQKTLDDALGTGGLKIPFSNSKFTYWLNQSIQKAFRSYTNPTATYLLFESFGLNQLIFRFGNYIQPINQYLFAKYRDSQTIKKNMELFDTSPSRLYRSTAQYFSNGVAYHGTKEESSFRSILLQGILPSDNGTAGDGLYVVDEENLDFAVNWAHRNKDLVVQFQVNPQATLVDITEGEGKQVFEKYGKNVSEFAEAFGIDIVRYDYPVRAYVVKNSEALYKASGHTRKVIPISELLYRAKAVKNIYEIKEIYDAISLMNATAKDFQTILELIDFKQFQKIRTLHDFEALGTMIRSSQLARESAALFDKLIDYEALGSAISKPSVKVFLTFCLFKPPSLLKKISTWNKLLPTRLSVDEFREAIIELLADHQTQTLIVEDFIESLGSDRLPIIKSHIDLWQFNSSLADLKINKMQINTIKILASMINYGELAKELSVELFKSFLYLFHKLEPEKDKPGIRKIVSILPAHQWKISDIIYILSSTKPTEDTNYSLLIPEIIRAIKFQDIIKSTSLQEVENLRNAIDLWKDKVAPDTLDLLLNFIDYNGLKIKFESINPNSTEDFIKVLSLIESNPDRPRFNQWFSDHPSDPSLKFYSYWHAKLSAYSYLPRAKLKSLDDIQSAIALIKDRIDLSLFLSLIVNFPETAVDQSLHQSSANNLIELFNLPSINEIFDKSTVEDLIDLRPTMRAKADRETPKALGRKVLWAFDRKIGKKLCQLPLPELLALMNRKVLTDWIEDLINIGSPYEDNIDFQLARLKTAALSDQIVDNTFWQKTAKGLRNLDDVKLFAKIVRRATHSHINRSEKLKSPTMREYIQFTQSMGSLVNWSQFFSDRDSLTQFIKSFEIETTDPSTHIKPPEFTSPSRSQHHLLTTTLLGLIIPNLKEERFSPFKALLEMEDLLTGNDEFALVMIRLIDAQQGVVDSTHMFTQALNYLVEKHSHLYTYEHFIMYEELYNSSLERLIPLLDIFIKKLTRPQFVALKVAIASAASKWPEFNHYKKKYKYRSIPPGESFWFHALSQYISNKDEPDEVFDIEFEDQGHRYYVKISRRQIEQMKELKAGTISISFETPKGLKKLSISPLKRTELVQLIEGGRYSPDPASSPTNWCLRILRTLFGE